MQVDHEIRDGRIDAHLAEYLLVQCELIGLQIDAGEQRVFFQHEVCDASLIKHISLFKLGDFLHALKQEEQLRGERCLLPVLIEPLQKRVQLSLFKQQVVVKGIGDAPREGGFAHTNGTLHRNVARHRSAAQRDAG